MIDRRAGADRRRRHRATCAQTLEAMRGHAERGESFADEDQQFHRLLFRCLDNGVADAR